MNLSVKSQVIHNTFTIERTYAASPQRVFAAFADPSRKRRWFGHNPETFEMDFRVGGIERVISRLGPDTPFPGVPLITEGVYNDIVPDARIVNSCTMWLGDRRISASLLTIELLPNGAGTDLICTHQAAFFEGSDGPVMRESGWRTILDSLEQELAGK